MTSPKEPGHSRPSDAPGGANGATGTPGATPEGEVPPWQRGPTARAGATRPAEQPPRPAEGSRPGSHSPGVDARLNRFIAGGSTPARETPQAPQRETEVIPTRTERPEPARPEATRSENYASELPDLSGPPPRPAARPAGAAPAATGGPERSDRGTGAAEPRSTPPATRVQASRKQGPVRASMQIRRIDPWSTLKVSLVLSAALFFVWMIAVAFLYLVLGGMGVWSKLNSNVGDLLTSNSGTGGELVSSGTIFGGAALIGLVNIVLLTAMATAGAFIYNLTTDLVGGVEVTLADRD
ncbi:MAG: DUF3566 domain-containing protein [Mycolicibacterium cosmeticum]|nr:DUF3566 domain-containing protein [Mycolicibacterium cosmeticum]